MNNIAYLYCDLRIDKWILKSIGFEKYAINYTIKKIKELHCSKIVAGIFDCDENKPLCRILEANGIQVLSSSEPDYIMRFLSFMCDETDYDYIIRVCGTKVLIDPVKINQILEEMNSQRSDLFYERSSASILPDIVSVKCLNRLKNMLMEEGKYIKILKNEKTVVRYHLPYPCILLYDFRINSNEGFRICKYVIENGMDVFELSKELAAKLIWKDSYLHKTGLLGSWILPSHDIDFYFDDEKNINPWWGMTIIDFVKKRLKKEFFVFEWGAGNSTLFWGGSVSKVVSVEYNIEWYKKIKGMIPDNVNLIYCELEYDGEYCRKILNETVDFDIILIDGRDRVNCAKNAVHKLKEDGIIIWDNSERDYYKEGYDYLEQLGFKRLELNSVIYGVPGVDDYTSIFYKDNNIFDL